MLGDIGMVQKRLSEAAKKRLRAGRLLLSGRNCAEVAVATGVARQTVYTWKRLLDEGGIDALRAVPERGRPARLDERQLASVRSAILQSPTEHGFGTELWTLKRVGAVIERMHGVRFSQTQVWRILGSLGLARKSLTSVPSSAMRTPCAPGGAAPGLRLKKSPARRATDRLRRRVRDQRASHAGTHMGAQGTNADHSVPLQLETMFRSLPG
jgi:transposase